MATMTISDLRPAGHALLSDSEGFISDLSDEELGLRGAFFASISQPASNSGHASASNSDYSDSASDSGYSNSNSASHSAPASHSSYSAPASHSSYSAPASHSGYSASASYDSHYQMPSSHNQSYC